MDVFNLLFKNKCSSVCCKHGKMYSRCDFSSNYFCDDDFVNYIVIMKCLCCISCLYAVLLNFISCLIIVLIFEKLLLLH